MAEFLLNNEADGIGGMLAGGQKRFRVVISLRQDDRMVTPEHSDLCCNNCHYLMMGTNELTLLHHGRY